MSIKQSVKPYFHYLYRTIKFADGKLHEHHQEELVNVIIEDIVRLDALISLLVYVDHTLPVIRCQKAFATLKSDLENIYYLYREQRLIGHRHHATLGWQIGKAIDLDIAILGEKFKSQSYDLYLNTVHATEQIVGKHINHISDEQFTAGTLAYFTDCLEQIDAFDIDERLDEVGYLIRGLLANLHFVAYIANNKESLKEERFFNLLTDAVSILKTMHVYQITLKSMGSSNQLVGDLATELQSEYDNNMLQLKTEYQSIIDSKNVIVDYIKIHHKGRECQWPIGQSIYPCQKSLV